MQIANTWEYIISIFKGLTKQFDHKFLLLYEEIIVIALTHTYPNIRALTRCIFDIKDQFSVAAKCILEKIENEVCYVTSTKSDSATKKTTEAGQAKEVRIAGSFLNRKSSTIKSVSSKSSEKTDKSAPILPEPDSQVNNITLCCTYFYIYLTDIFYIFKFVIGLCVHKNRSEIRR